MPAGYGNNNNNNNDGIDEDVDSHDFTRTWKNCLVLFS